MGIVQESMTTATEFVFFKEECQRFISFFGLNDWKILFDHSELEGAKANCAFDAVGKVATITLATNYIFEANWARTSVEQSMLCREREITQSAYHEVLELLLADSWHVSMDSGLGYGQKGMYLEQAHHAVIRRLENAYFCMS